MQLILRTEAAKANYFGQELAALIQFVIHFFALGFNLFVLLLNVVDEHKSLLDVLPVPLPSLRAAGADLHSLDNS